MPRAGFLTRPGLTLPPISPQQGGVSAGVSWLQAAPAQGPLGDLKAGVLLSSLPLTCRDPSGFRLSSLLGDMASLSGPADLAKPNAAAAVPTDTPGHPQLAGEERAREPSTAPPSDHLPSGLSLGWVGRPPDTG